MQTDLQNYQIMSLQAWTSNLYPTHWLFGKTNFTNCVTNNKLVAHTWEGQVPPRDEVPMEEEEEELANT